MNIRLLILSFSLFFVYSCRDSKKINQKLMPGISVAKSEIPVADDSLNKFTFSVEVKADSLVAQGVFDVYAKMGNTIAEDRFTMPTKDASLTPIIRVCNEPNTFMIGFYLEGDTTFHDYYKISGARYTIKMQYSGNTYKFE